MKPLMMMRTRGLLGVVLGKHACNKPKCKPAVKTKSTGAQYSVGIKS
jgi:hypothetical protein